MIWFQLIVLAVSFLLSALLAPKPNIENARAQELDDGTFPRANEGDPVPFVSGTRRLLAPNTLWYGNFRSEPITEKVKTGLFSSKTVTVGYNYFLTFQLGLCLGPGVRLKKIWIDKDVLWEGDIGGGTTIGISQPALFGGEKEGGGFSGSATFYDGSFVQVQDPTLTQNLGTVPAYRGIAHIVFADCNIGESAQLRQLSFEVSLLTNDLGLAIENDTIGGTDENALEVMYQIMTKPYGGLGLDINNDLDAAEFFAVGQLLGAELNGMSLLINRSVEGKTAVQEVLRQIDGILYQDAATGKIKPRLIRQDYNIDTIPSFNEDEIIEVRDFTRTAWVETRNQVRVTYTDRDNNYEDRVAIQQDQANINSKGRVVSTNFSMPGVTVASLANQIAVRELSQLSVPLFKAEMHMNRLATQLVPGDVFLFSWADYRLSNVVMRVQNYNLGDLLDGRVVLNAVQDSFAADIITFAAPGTTLWQPLDRTAIEITLAAIIEIPYYLATQIDATEFTQPSSSSQGPVMALAKKPNGVQQGYSTSLTQDAFATTIDGIIRQGYTPTAQVAIAILATDGFVSGTLASISVQSLSDSAASVFTSQTLSQIQNNSSGLFIIGNEIFAYQSFTDNLNGTYTLNNVYRALLDTGYESHAVSDPVYFISSADSFVLTNFAVDGTPIVGRFLSFTDRDEFAFASASDVTTGVTQQRYWAPIAPDNFRINTTRTTVAANVMRNDVLTLNWNERSRLDNVIRLETNATQTPEGGQTYTIHIFQGGVVYGEVTGVTGTTTNFTIPNIGVVDGAADIRIFAVRDGITSISASTIPINITT